MEPNLENIAAHYENIWIQKGRREHWAKGPIWELPPGFHILAFSPTSRRRMWTYATCGMAAQPDAPAIELHLFSLSETEAHVELLTATAHYHFTGDYLDLGHTVNFGRAWLPGSKCDHGLISLPYLDGPKLEWLNAGIRKIRFLWLVPITAQEVEFKNAHGLEKLESRLESSRFNSLDPLRPSVV
jgi:hypothetical protein